VKPSAGLVLRPPTGVWLTGRLRHRGALCGQPLLLRLLPFLAAASIAFLIPVLALGTTEAAIALAVPSARAGALAQPKRR